MVSNYRQLQLSGRLFGAIPAASGLWSSGSTPRESRDEVAKWTLASVTSKAEILRAWNQVRREFMSLRSKDTRLVHDPLDYLAFHIHRDQFAEALCQRVRSGQYVPHRALIVRAAKRNRLTRPLVFPCLEDTLVLTAICRILGMSLARDVPEWVSYGGRTTKVSRSVEYENWFNEFLKHRARSDRVAKNPDDLIISTDIANFFATVNLDYLQHVVTAASNVDSSTLSLLFRLLRELGAAGPYDPFSLHGLPQEQDDNSRLLANFYLRELDQTLQEVGAEGRYSRFMDDMVLSARSHLEASHRVYQIQTTLERIGLSVNSSKTEVMSKEDFQEDHHPQENAYLDVLTSGPLFLPFAKESFDAHARKFAKSSPRGSWIQVMRRQYSVARYMESRVLLPFAWRHIREYPELAPDVLDYLQVVQPTLSLVKNAFELVKTDGSVYDSMQILVYESILHTPFPNSSRLRERVLCEAWEHLAGTSGYRPVSSYVSSLIALTIYKFGKSTEVNRLAELVGGNNLSIELARQLYVILRASNDHQGLAHGLLARFDDSEMWRLMTFFDRLELHTSDTLKHSYNWLVPKKTTQPMRYIFRTRMLPVYAAAARYSDARAELQRIVEVTEFQLKSSRSTRHIDCIALAKIRELCSFR